MKFSRKKRILKRFAKTFTLKLENRDKADNWIEKRPKVLRKARKNIKICEKILEILQISNKSPETSLTQLREKLEIFQVNFFNMFSNKKHRRNCEI